MSDRALIEQLRAKAWQSSTRRNSGGGLSRPQDHICWHAADRLEALTGGEAVAWRLDENGFSSHIYDDKRDAEIDQRRFGGVITPLYLSPPSGRGVGREEIETFLEGVGNCFYKATSDAGWLISRAKLTEDLFALFSSPSLGGEGKQEDTASRADLSSASRSPMPSPDGWRELGSEPRDGSEFIVYREDAGVFAAVWQHPPHEDGGLDWDEAPTLFSSGGYDLTQEPPTHWMPLPPAPGPQAQQDVGER